MNDQIIWQNIRVSPCETFHLYNGKPLYSQRYCHVMKYHNPGLASAKNDVHAFHVNIKGLPAYSNRFIETFGFYEYLAAVKNEEGWFHITPKGKAIYSTRYKWCGNFQEGFCPVKDQIGYYFHINSEGKKSYLEKYNYVGDFKEGIAVVCNELGLHTHIDLDVFHKGFARAKNEEGWLHINKNGKPIYDELYLMIEPFYNGIARVETKYKELLLITQSGDKVCTLRKAFKR